ncbi:MAG TPA: transporter [Verrucomicrobiae bacterium]|nr:transporter [Verrucomicrobiae bacterium]
MKMRFAGVCALVGALAVCSVAQAERPLTAVDATTVGQGKFKLEVGGEFGSDKSDDRSSSDDRRRMGEIAASLTGGVSDLVDLIVEVPFMFTSGGSEEDAWGAGDIEVEAKIRFLEQDNFAMALMPHITLPTGKESHGFGTGSLSAGLKLIASTDQKPYTLSGNIGFANKHLSTVGKEPEKNVVSAAVGATAEVSEHVRLVGDLDGEIALSKNHEGKNEKQAYFVAGVIWSAAENLDFDLGVRTGLTKESTDLTVLAGVAVKF